MSDVAPSRPAAGAPRRLLLLAGTIAFGVFFGFVAATAFAAWAAGLMGAIAGLVLGLVLAWGLPLFLAVRANLALKRQKRPVLLRRIVALALVALVQVTVFLAGFVQLGQGTATTTGELAQAALPVLGPVPFVGGMLEKAAKDGGASVAATTTPTTTTPTDPTAMTTPGPDGGVATVASDTPTGLSPRGPGRRISALAALATTTEGDLVALRFGLLFGGMTTMTVTSLSAFADKGAPTRVESSSDGFFAAVLAGQFVLVAPPDKPAVLDAATSRGAKLGDLEIQSVRDIAIGPAGDMLLAVDAFDAKTNAVVQALVAKPASGSPFVVRRAGTPVDNAAKREGEVTNTTFGYSIKRSDGSGSVVVEEVILEGDADVGMKLDGAQFAMNPRRLLVGRIDTPRALAELTRTGDQPSGIADISFQGFADAVALPDGRVVFDANFAEDGPRGWLFQARLGGGAFAVAPDLVGKPEAPFAERAPRTAMLSVEPEGHFAFVSRDGALVVGDLQHLTEAKTSLLRADVIGAGGSVGGVSRVNAPRLATGGEWVFAAVDVLDSAGQRHEALVLASRQDLTAGTVELLAIEGGVVPTARAAPMPTATPTPATPTAPPATTPAPGAAPDAKAPATTAPRIKSLFVLEGHDEPLWGLTR